MPNCLPQTRPEVYGCDKPGKKVGFSVPEGTNRIEGMANINSHPKLKIEKLGLLVCSIGI